MVVDIGEKVHVIERRGFDGDLRRHFFGVVDRVDGASMRVTGYVFVFDAGANSYVRGNGQRTRVLSLTSSGLIINVAPDSTDTEKVQYVDRDGRLVVTDLEDFSLDVNEFGVNR